MCKKKKSCVKPGVISAWLVGHHGWMNGWMDGARSGGFSQADQVLKDGIPLLSFSSACMAAGRRHGVWRVWSSSSQSSFKFVFVSFPLLASLFPIPIPPYLWLLVLVASYVLLRGLLREIILFFMWIAVFDFFIFFSPYVG